MNDLSGRQVSSIEFAIRSGISVALVNFLLNRAYESHKEHSYYRLISGTHDTIIPSQREIDDYISMSLSAGTGTGKHRISHTEEFMTRRFDLIPHASVMVDSRTDMKLVDYIKQGAGYYQSRTGKHLQVTLGEILRALRLREGLSRRELGIALADYEDRHETGPLVTKKVFNTRRRGAPYSESTIKNFEEELTRPTQAKLDCLLEVLRASPQEKGLIIEWHRKQEIARAESPDYISIANHFVTSHWGNVKLFAQEVITPQDGAAWSGRKIEKILHGESFPTRNFHKTLRSMLETKDAADEFDTQVDILQSESRKFFAGLLQSSPSLRDSLVTLRVMLGLSTANLAERLGIETHTIISGWEAGSRRPSPSQFREICELMEKENIPPYAYRRVIYLYEGSIESLKDDKDVDIIRENIAKLRGGKTINDRHIFLPTCAEHLDAMGRRRDEATRKCR